ncbi:MAG TPA: low affinity iron permease family protein [Candidatus Binatia bacterium]|nr:low affinity iron permease family protein [Candidatus Binatia bacterium]
MAQRRRRSPIGGFLERFSEAVTRSTGGSFAFGIACLVVLVWIATGPFFGFSDTWQLVINTGTTIVTFLMVFLIQRTQNKEGMALQLKLNELVAAMEGASNRLIDVEDLNEQELQTLRQHYKTLSRLSKRDTSLTQSHSVEEADLRHRSKHARRRRV